MAKSRKAPPDRGAVTDEEKRLREFTAEFLADWRADKPFRDGMREDNDFYDGHQWEDEDRSVLEGRGQPCVTVNRIKPKMDAIFGMQEGMIVDTKAYAKGDREAEVQALSEFFREVEDDNDFDGHESRAFEDIMIAGRAWYKVGKRWDGLKSYHCVKRAYVEDCVPDRNAREADHSDAKRVHETVWMDLADAQAMFPHAKEKLARSADDGELDRASDPANRRVRPDQYQAAGPVLSKGDLGEFVDGKNRRVRIVTTWYRTLSPRKLYFHPALEAPADITDFGDKELETLRAAHPNGQTVTQMEKKLHSYTFTWNAELEHLQDIRPYDKEAKFPLIMMEGYRERNRPVNYGIVRQMKDPQREVNKRRSKDLHLISVNRTIAEKGTFTNEQAAKEEVQKPDCFLLLQPGGFARFKIENNLDMSQAHFQLLQLAIQEIDAAGVPRELEGRSGGSSSGREFQLRQQQAVQGIRKPLSNLRSGRRRVGLYLLEEWNQEHPDQAVPKTDVLVEEGQDTVSLQQETFEKLVSLAEKGAIPPDDMDLVIKVSSLEPAMKKEFLERIQARRQAQAQMLEMQAQAAAGGAVPAAGGVQ